MQNNFDGKSKMHLEKGFRIFWFFHIFCVCVCILLCAEMCNGLLSLGVGFWKKQYLIHYTCVNAIERVPSGWKKAANSWCSIIISFFFYFRYFFFATIILTTYYCHYWHQMFLWVYGKNMHIWKLSHVFVRSVDLFVHLVGICRNVAGWNHTKSILIFYTQILCQYIGFVCIGIAFIAFGCLRCMYRQWFYLYFRFLFVCWSFNRVKRKWFLYSDHFTPFKISYRVVIRNVDKEKNQYENQWFCQGPPLQISMWKEIWLLIEHLSNIYCWWLFCVFFGFWKWCERRIVFYLSRPFLVCISCVWEKGFCDCFEFVHIPSKCASFHLIVTIRWIN